MTFNSSLLTLLITLFGFSETLLANTSTYPRTANEVWANYHSKIVTDPINKLVQMTDSYDGVKMELVQYDLGTLFGTQRVASPKITAYYAYPATASASNKVPAVVLVHGGGQVPDWFQTWWWASQGYACIYLNWGGKPMASFGFNTILTESNYLNTDWDGLAAGFIRDGVTGAVHHEPIDAESYVDGSTLFAEAHPMNNSFLLNSYATRRALTFLSQQAEVDSTKLGITGHSMGGITTVISGTDPRVKCIAPSVGGTGWDYEKYWGLETRGKNLYLSFLPDFPIDSTAEELANFEWYKTAVSQESYWPYIQAPSLFIEATNDFNAPFDAVQRSIDLLPSQVKSNIALTTHNNHRFNKDTEITRLLWMRTHLDGDFDFPDQASSHLDLSHTSKTPIYTVTPDQTTSSEILKVDVYYGYDPFALERFWHKAVAVETSPGTWQAACPVFDTDEPLFTYAVITYDLGDYITYPTGDINPHGSFSITGEVKIAYPADLQASGIIADNSRSRLIDAGNNDLQDWYSQTPNIYVPFDYGTYKFGAPKFQGPAGSYLSFEITTDQANNYVALSFQESWQDLTARGVNNTYQAIVAVPNAGTSTIYLAPNQVLNKGTNQSLTDWTNIELVTALPAQNVNSSYPAWSGSAPKLSNVSWFGGVYLTGNSNLSPIFEYDNFAIGSAISGASFTESLFESAHDPETQAISYSKVLGPDWLTINTDGFVNGMPTDENAGINRWIIMATDALGGKAYASIEIEVEITNNNKAQQITFKQDSNWSSQAVSADSEVVINGSSINLDQNATIASLVIGDSMNYGVLTIYQPLSLNLTNPEGMILGEEGGIGVVIQTAGEVNTKRLTISGNTYHKSTYALFGGTLSADELQIKANGELIISGGTFYKDISEAGAISFNGDGIIDLSAGALNIVNGTASEATILNTDIIVSGGQVNLESQVFIGLNTETDFTIMGNQASVKMLCLNMSVAGNQGTLAYILDQTRISPIEVNNWSSLANATLVIDGSDYSGGEGEIILLKSGYLLDSIPSENIQVFGFGNKGLQATVVQDTPWCCR
jgi:dienelactone hydrolase